MSEVRCTSCGSEWPGGQRFCGTCGASLPAVCAVCGTLALTADQRFCGGCGAPLDVQATGSSSSDGPTLQLPGERRLVSVLFADIVGFTPFSEQHDAEDVRDMLEQYFAVCASVIEHHGGTIAKYVGDAVMAVWGAPQAQEDDAERAVRAGLALASGVSSLGGSLGIGLRARVGVLTGEAAVRVGAEREGMLVGDSVNTASRIQSIAEPGTVLVDDGTRRATQAAIAFQEAGLHSLKGKLEPMRLWRADRVVANVGGAGRTEGLEAPLAGRDAELRAVIDAFEASARHGRAELTTVIGGPGLGKSRLAWELEKYVDGIADLVMWHRGRCLSYGEGVAFWALAEMVRMRARIADEEDAATARAKLSATVERHVPDPAERELIEPRLAALLGLERRQAGDQADLFAAWRLFVERLAEEAPVVLVFEDLHRADSGLLNFIDYLLEWSAERPVFMLALARPELGERRPEWVAGRPCVTSVALEPLDDAAMDTLLHGLLAGHAAAVSSAIRDRAAGVPLYAVEIVRMLVDRGVLVRQGDHYVPTGPVEEIEIPETLHALIAARLDGLALAERRLLQDAAVLGLSFTPASLAAVSGLPETEVRAALQGLAAKEFVTLDADPVSPERGQYKFLQGLVRRVAYGTLTRRDRKERHLRAAEHLEQAFGPESVEFADVLAAHYLDAAAADPDARDVAEIGARARQTLIAAGERARRLAAGEQAAAYFARAAELTDAPLERADLLDRSGQAAVLVGELSEAQGRFEAAIELLDAGGERRRAAVVSARIADIAEFEGGLQESRERLKAAYATLVEGERDADLAEIAYKLATREWEAGDPDADEHLEIALELAERLRLTDTLVAALTAKWVLLTGRGRNHEGLALLKYALDLAVEHGLVERAMRVHNNLAMHLAQLGQPEQALEHAEAGAALARRHGDRLFESALLANTPLLLFRLGRWGDALDVAAQLREGRADAIARIEALLGSLLVRLARGEQTLAEDDLGKIHAIASSADRPEMLTIRAAARAAALEAAGDPSGVLRAAESDIPTRDTDLFLDTPRIELLVSANAAAIALGDLARADERVAYARALLESGDSPYLAAHVERFDAQIAARRGDRDAAQAGFARAIAGLRELADPFALAIVLLERAEDLPDLPGATEARAEARALFERLGARPHLERAATTPGPLSVA